MLIPVAHLSHYGSITGSILFDTNLVKFQDSNQKYERPLPVQDYLTCSVVNNNICTVVGKIKSRNTYVICFGDNFCYEVDKKYLSRKILSNIRITKENRYMCVDGKFEYLDDLFPDANIKFISEFYGKNISSRGAARKFSVLYHDKLSIVKFSKGNPQDLKNEIIYKEIADSLGVKCCDVYDTKYFGKNCVVSIFEYGDNDIYVSFKNLNRSIDNIVSAFNREDQIMFDKYMLLDYILLQQDRHFSNLAVVNNRLYPLFDNGECLGLGPISYFSSEFRKYIERLDKRYLQTLFNRPDRSILKDLDAEQKLLVENEVSKIW